jgi:hypothetical protein
MQGNRTRHRRATAPAHTPAAALHRSPAPQPGRLYFGPAHRHRCSRGRRQAPRLPAAARMPLAARRPRALVLSCAAAAAAAAASQVALAGGAVCTAAPVAAVMRRPLPGGALFAHQEPRVADVSDAPALLQAAVCAPAAVLQLQAQHLRRAQNTGARLDDTRAAAGPARALQLQQPQQRSPGCCRRVRGSHILAAPMPPRPWLLSRHASAGAGAEACGCTSALALGTGSPRAALPLRALLMHKRQRRPSPMGLGRGGPGAMWLTARGSCAGPGWAGGASKKASVHRIQARNTSLAVRAGAGRLRL